MSNLGDEPAYPTDDNVNRPDERGLNKRELFAAMIVQGFLAAEKHEGISGAHLLLNERANAAVAQADALLAELAKEAGDAEPT